MFCHDERLNTLGRITENVPTNLLTCRDVFWWFLFSYLSYNLLLTFLI